MSVPIKNFWQDKAVLITGASSGIGWALTEELAQYGVHFGLLSRRQLRMQQLADSLRGSGSKFWIRSCDVRDVSRFFRQFRNLSASPAGLMLRGSIAGSVFHLLMIGGIGIVSRLCWTRI